MAFDITKAVGRGPKANLNPLDIAKVQALLTAYFLGPGANPAILNGWIPGLYQPSIGDAIELFQKKNTLPSRDGRVDPNGTTLRKLNSFFPNLPIPDVPSIDPPIPPSGVIDIFTKHDDTSGYRGTVYDPPQLASATGIDHDWDIQFGGVPGRKVDAWYYETMPKVKVRYVGVCCPQGVRDPDAYLLYFHHHAKREPGFYQSEIDFLNFGVGDYMIGRMQCIRQLARSGKNVAIVVASPVIGGQSEFIHDESWVKSLLLRIDSDILGIPVKEVPPLMVAGYSSGSEDMQTFLAKCPSLASKVKAIYDFDGGWIGNFNPAQINAASKAGAQALRYMGGGVAELGPKEDVRKYFNRYQGMRPQVIPLPVSRWKAHREFHLSKFASPVGWWMHAHIPSCMLMHALTHTDFLR